MVMTWGSRVRREGSAGKVTPPESSDRSGRHGVHPQKAQLNPGTAGLGARLMVRALVVAAAAVMALGFLGPEAALLVAVLTVLTFVLLWARSLAERSREGSGRSRRVGAGERPLPD